VYERPADVQGLSDGLLEAQVGGLAAQLLQETPPLVLRGRAPQPGLWRRAWPIHTETSTSEALIEVVPLLISIENHIYQEHMLQQKQYYYRITMTECI